MGKFAHLATDLLLAPAQLFPDELFSHIVQPHMHVPRCTATIDSFIVPEQVLWYTAAHYARRLVELCPLGPDEVQERAARKSGVRRAADEAAVAEQATKAAASRTMSAGAHVPNDWCNFL